MLILANVLEFNGGTTFILRLCRALRERGRRASVLVLFDRVDKALLENIKETADVFFLRDLVRRPLGVIQKSPLSIFTPIDFSRLEKLISDAGRHVHVMGVFGLLLVERYLQSQRSPLRLSIGVYHQNEFMFRCPDYYFVRKTQKIFQIVPPESLIFFNEENQASYSRFFGRSYEAAIVVPIGVELPTKTREINGCSESCRLVSVGNLHDFKTYNEHVINTLPDLRRVRPNLVYEIYGEGPNEGYLHSLVSAKGLQDAVKFKGRVPYAQFSSVLEGAFAFVGSGTAIIEAAALGIPSVIGVESTKDPVTYGFLSDIPGLAYNEFGQKKPMIPMKDKLLSILDGQDAWTRAALECMEKAKCFGIDETIDGFLSIDEKDVVLEWSALGQFNSFRAALSFLRCVIMHALRVDTTFASRRNQGTIA